MAQKYGRLDDLHGSLHAIDLLKWQFSIFFHGFTDFSNFGVCFYRGETDVFSLPDLASGLELQSWDDLEGIFSKHAMLERSPEGTDLGGFQLVMRVPL